ncbi:uncharacterized protein LOC110824349 [Carica papaya]|uniref:uncharacterized protein LOC110824349 n=1 Tax=Carica papaya TaxID=3649 RepID=UPI000B8C7BED|nr:uncharacterized protein LOC110824349 [Carica papaya]
MLSSRFSFLGSGGSNKVDESSNVLESNLKPTLKLQTDKDVYRPGDSIVITIEICNPDNGAAPEGNPTLLVERLRFEVKGIEKLDIQWFATQKPLPGSKQRRDVVRATLPDILPPSYKGATIRYLYYVRSTLLGRWMMLENGRSNKESKQFFFELETRIPLQIWVTQKSNGLLMEGHNDGIVPATAFQMDLYWKEMDGDSEWARANDINDSVDEGYDSSRDEVSSVSSYNLSKENIHKTFGSSLSLQSSATRSSFKDSPYLEGARTSLSSNLAVPHLSVAEVLYDSTLDILSPHKSSNIVSSSPKMNFTKENSADDFAGVSSTSGARGSEPVASEGFIRGRSYNIRMDDQVLLRFSPKNSDSTYYFSDMIGGTLTFFNEGIQRCLEVSITLETSETINRLSLHPSRRNSPTITKVQSDHHEVVADLVQTSFLFSVPMDGPMTFSTNHVSVQWSLRFEFFTTPKYVDWRRYEHPLLIEARERSEWVLPITVHAPPTGASSAHPRNEKPFTLEPLWVRS